MHIIASVSSVQYQLRISDSYVNSCSELVNWKYILLWKYLLIPELSGLLDIMHGQQSQSDDGSQEHERKMCNCMRQNSCCRERIWIVCGKFIHSLLNLSNWLMSGSVDTPSPRITERDHSHLIKLACAVLVWWQAAVVETWMTHWIQWILLLTRMYQGMWKYVY